MIARAGLALALALGCSRQAEEAPPPVAPPAVDAAPARAGQPAWLVKLPSTPGLPVLQGTGGPLLADGAVIVASSAIGFAAVDAATGELLWQHTGEERPFDPVLVDGAVWLPGRCSHRPRPAPDAVACVDVVAPRTGVRTGGEWVRAPAGVGRAEPIGVVDGALWWAGDGVVWRVVDGAPAIVERRGAGAVAVSASALGVVWRDRVRTADGQVLTMAEPALRGVAGPVRIGDRLAVVRDDTLAWWPAAPRTPELRLSFAPGALVGGARGRAVGLEGGLHIVSIDPTGEIVGRGPRVPGLQAHRAVTVANGALVVASRRDATLRHDDVTWFDADGAPRWTWPVPEPADPQRLDAVGVAADHSGVYVFFDGRQLARLRP